MKNIESYNSSYPLAYYEVGSVYSFYGHTSAKGTPATTEAIQKYAFILNELVMDEQEAAIQPVKGTNENTSVQGGLNRFYAVVIDKVKAKNSAYIVVMLCNKYNSRTEYYTRSYSVDYGCKTDGKDSIPVVTHLDFESKISGKVGGITLAGKSEKVGGITRANRKDTFNASVGGITKAHQPNKPSTSVTNTNTKVGGITLARNRKVGGITKAK